MGICRFWRFAGSIAVTLTLSFLVFTNPALADGKDDFERAGTAWNNDDYETVVEAMTAALESGDLEDDDLVTAYFLLGDSLWELDRDEDAIPYLTKAIDTGNLAPFYFAYAYYERGLANWVLDHDEEALADMDKAVEMSEDKGAELYFRALILKDLDRNEEAVRDVIRLAREYPDMLENLDTRHAWDLEEWLEDQDKKDQLFDYLYALEQANYSGPKLDEFPDGLRKELVLLYLERDEINKAVVQAYKIESPYITMEMLIDNRFEPLWGKYVFTSHADLGKLVEKTLDEYRTKMEDNPYDPKYVHWYVDTLREAGHDKEAVEVSKEALKNWSRFENTEEDDKLWVLNMLAYAYIEMGENKKGYKAFDEIMEVSLDENGSAISQVINYSLALLDAGEFKRALKIVEDTGMEYSSDYGDMFFLGVKACALHELGREEEAETIADEMKERWEENSSTVQVALLCLERYEDSVEVFLARLEDENERGSLLAAIQNFAPGKDDRPYRDELLMRYQRVLNDPRVTAAIGKYGRIIEIPLPAPYWADF